MIDPVFVHSEKVPTVYLPATNSCIIQLFKILTKCKVYSSKDVSIRELSDLIDVLGIENFDVGESEMVVENFDNGESEKVVENLTNDSNQVEVENSYNNENHECMICHKTYTENKLLWRHRNKKHKGKHKMSSNSNDVIDPLKSVISEESPYIFV